ncbi:MAG: hypothetical protein KDC71_19355 [Acidobacteria bacterium]|nr:hypothetical protein [Acidobacteriota bacterium]
MRLTFFWILSISAWAQINLRTNIQSVLLNAYSEAGGITTAVQGDVFPDISSEQPVFIAYRFLYGASLSQTLVDYQGDGHVNRPINLAIQYEGNLLDHTVVAPPDAVSIVRWVRGEDTIWVKIQTPPRLWLQRQGSPASLNPQNACAFRIGLSARNSFNFASSQYDQGRANLRANSRIDAPHTIENTAVSTLILLDLTQFTGDLTSSLFPPGFLAQTIYLNPDSVIYPEPPPATVEAGMPLFAGDDSIMRLLPDSEAPTNLFVTTATCQSNPDGLVPLNFRVSVHVIAEEGTQIEIHLPNNSEYGFVFGDLISLEPHYDWDLWAGDIPQEVTREGYQLGVTTTGVVDEAYVPKNARFFETPGGKTLSRDAVVRLAFGSNATFDLSLFRPISPTVLPASVEIVRTDYFVDRWLDSPPFELTQRGSPQNQHIYHPFNAMLGNFPGCTISK